MARNRFVFAMSCVIINNFIQTGGQGCQSALHPFWLEMGHWQGSRMGKNVDFWDAVRSWGTGWERYHNNFELIIRYFRSIWWNKVKLPGGNDHGQCEHSCAGYLFTAGMPLGITATHAKLIYEDRAYFNMAIGDVCDILPEVRKVHVGPLPHLDVKWGNVPKPEKKQPGIEAAKVLNLPLRAAPKAPSCPTVAPGATKSPPDDWWCSF